MITSAQRTAKKWPPRLSIRPINTPPTIAPVTLPKPPTTAAVNALTPAVKPNMKLVKLY
jgi:hypothetical protein